MTISLDVYQRLELRFLRGHYDWQHYVDVPEKATRAVCGLQVDLFSQWERNLDGRLAPACLRCILQAGEPWRL